MGSGASKENVLTVDDDLAMGKVLGALLAQEGYSAHHVASGAAALAALEARAFDLVVTDLRMPGMDGMALLAEIATRFAGLPVVMLTAHGTVPLAVQAMKAGAADFVLKPFDREELLFVVKKALAQAERGAASVPDAPEWASDLIGDSPAMQDVKAVVRRAAESNATVLLLGESGTGKELVARALRDASARKDKPFVKLHCGALPDTLLESELFGYEKGAFTGAATRKPGRVELADGGTLFLDEIGDVTPHMQVKLLRVLQEREFERLGGTGPIKVDVRFIAATHRDLAAMVAKGEFREDLYYRLNVVPVNLPPLRSRAGDIALLARKFVALHAKANGRRIDIGESAIARLEQEPWPGNVRQLQNFIERLVVLSDGPTIEERDVAREMGPRTTSATAPPATATSSPGAATNDSPSADLDTALRDAEKIAIQNALAKAGNNRTVAARILGVSRRALYYKLDAYGIA
jgi:DNA-binding NtrC family response regulator